MPAMASKILFSCFALSGAALPVSHQSVALLERGVDTESDLERELADFAAQLEEFEDRPGKKHAARNFTKHNRNSTAPLELIIKDLEVDFKEKTKVLKEYMGKFREAQKALDASKKEANLAMKEVRKEAEKRRRVMIDRKKAQEDLRKSKEEAKRTAKEAMVKKAETLMGAKASTELQGMMGSLTLGILVEVLFSLPAAVENPLFMKRINKAKLEVTTSVQDFLNITRRKTAKFVAASGRASDVELSFLMARYFHEASFRVKSMQTDAEKVARDLNVVMPRELREAFRPIVKQVRASAVPLRVNASTLAAASLTEACSQISCLMGNISDYNIKLQTMHTALHNIWQMSELMLPHMSKIYPMKQPVIDTLKDFMSLATTQTAGLQEAAEEIVADVGPVINERLQCQWSAAPRLVPGLVASLLALMVAAVAM